MCFWTALWLFWAILTYTLYVSGTGGVHQKCIDSCHSNGLKLTGRQP